MGGSASPFDQLLGRDGGRRILWGFAFTGSPPMVHHNVASCRPRAKMAAAHVKQSALGLSRDRSRGCTPNAEVALHGAPQRRARTRTDRPSGVH